MEGMCVKFQNYIFYLGESKYEMEYDRGFQDLVRKRWMYVKS